MNPIPVRSGVEVHRQDLGFRSPALEANRKNRLAHLVPNRSRIALEQELRDLLRDRRASLENAAAPDVVDHGSSEGERIDSRMNEESTVLRGQRRRDDDRRQLVRRKRVAPSARRRQRLVQNDPVAIDDGGGGKTFRVEESGIDRAESKP